MHLPRFRRPSRARCEAKLIERRIACVSMAVDKQSEAYDRLATRSLVLHFYAIRPPRWSCGGRARALQTLLMVRFADEDELM